jgi:hypothetical protein
MGKLFAFNCFDGSRGAGRCSASRTNFRSPTGKAVDTVVRVKSAIAKVFGIYDATESIMVELRSFGSNGSTVNDGGRAIIGNVRAGSKEKANDRMVPPVRDWGRT